MNFFGTLFVLSIIIYIKRHATFINGDIGDSCRHEKTNSPGICKLVFECREAISDIRQGIPLTHCGWQSVIQIVCCPSSLTPQVLTPPSQTFQQSNDESLRKSERKCREYANFVFENVTAPVGLPGRDPETVSSDTCSFKVIPLIVGGTNAKPREFPHMALIGYGDNVNSLQWNCGGSLISEKFVLSAAHCVFSREFGYASYARLGELNYDTTTDDAHPVDIAIETHIKHPEYTVKSDYNDIALFKLQKSATFNRYVRPICLSDKRNIREMKAIATGWGLTEYLGQKSNTLRKVTLELFSQSECYRIYEFPPSNKLSRGIDENSQICAGSYSEEKDTCEGDSGGPLQVYNLDVYCMYRIIGLTSFGKGCGSAGSPTVYTRTSNYIDWIESVVWPHFLIYSCVETLLIVKLVANKMIEIRKFSLEIITLFVILVFCPRVESNCSIGDHCRHGVSNAEGTAKLVIHCQSAIADLKKGIRPWGCGFQENIQIVCCLDPDDTYPITPKPATTVDRFSGSSGKERVSMRKCKEYAEYAYENITLPISIPGSPDITRRVNRCGFNVIPLIVGGTLAGPREFPHMCLIGYGDDPIQWKCGGTLISEYFVLTAGHCLNSQEYGPAKMVRVGDLNYESEQDEARPENVRIKRHVPFPEYTRRTQYNDLALLELERKVTFNPYVRPACLFTQFNTETDKAIATGWGRVEWAGDTSSNLLKVTLELFTHQECNKSFEFNINRKLSKGIVDESQLCAGSHSEEKDTCEGDSGGPLQIYNNNVYCMYNIIGVTSFGKGCGSVGQPGVYTRISNYLDWIEEVTWPNE
ncbi:uncharacterized protein LOC129805183 [Phlebotomus papatasi]|nr:uncharacterized protein LOC129805183 [Phlebotomus papatasi]